MRKVFLITVLCCAFVTAFCAVPATFADNLAITHVTVIDVVDSMSHADMTVLISANRIAHIGPSSHAALRVDSREVDGRGKFLIPGLWDMHVHWFDFAPTGSLDMSVFLPLFTANGITGVRQMSGEPGLFKWRKEIEAGTLLGPRMSIGYLVDGPPTAQGSRINSLKVPHLVVHDEAEARNAVRTIKEQGYEFVKVYSLLSRESYFAIEDEAKKLEIPFAGHVPDAISAWEASDAGQKSVEHLQGIDQYCSDSSDAKEANVTPEGYNGKKCAALFAEFRKNHTWQCPTLSVLYALNVVMADPALKEKFKTDPRLQYLPQFFAQMWQKAAASSRPEEALRRARDFYQIRQRIVKEMVRAGVGILAGTDEPNSFVYPGFGLHEELGLLVDAGLTPMQALQSATINPARYLNFAKDLGSVEAGKLADMVLLDADPLQNIHNTQKLFAVIENGKLFAKPELEKMLADVAVAAAHTGSRQNVPQ